MLAVDWARLGACYAYTAIGISIYVAISLVGVLVGKIIQRRRSPTADTILLPEPDVALDVMSDERPEEIAS